MTTASTALRTLDINLTDTFNRQRVMYLLRCLAGVVNPQRYRCPSCGARRSDVIGRHKIVTALVRCADCRLLFRVPLDPPSFGDDFYQTDYECLYATDCPTEERLAALMARAFAGSSMDYASRIRVLEALGVTPGQRILDFGASWGYGTWQFARAGYDVTAYEISRPRARYARERLGVCIEDDVNKIEGRFDVFFSSHVLEHLPSPRVALDLAHRYLRPGGLFVAFTPNGSMDCLAADPREYHRYWGSIHPLYLSDEFYIRAFRGQAKVISSASYDGQYDFDRIRRWNRRDDLLMDRSQSELLVAAVHGHR